MRSLLLLLATFVLLAQAPTPSPEEIARKQLEYTRAHYTKYDYRIPMRDGVKLFTSVYVPKDDLKKYPILIERTPYSVAPYGINNYRGGWGHPIYSPKKASSSCIRMCAAAICRKARSSMLPCIRPTSTGPRDTDESTDTYDTIDWLVKNVPDNNGSAGMWGISYPGFYAAYGLIDSASRAESRFAASSHGRRRQWRRCLPQRRVLIWRRISASMSSFKPRGVEPERPRRTVPFDFGRPTNTTFTCTWVRSPTATKSISRTRIQLLERQLLEHDTYDELLAVPRAWRRT